MTEEQEKPKEEEQKDSGVPKNFLITCHGCLWARPSSGVSVDLKDLTEITKSCSTCGKDRRFRCPRCGDAAIMKRIRGNT